MFSIAVDGTSGSGKSTITSLLSKKLGILHLNTGALYRAVGLYLIKNNIDARDEKLVVSKLGDIKIEVEFNGTEQITILNGEDVSSQLYSLQVSDICSISSAYVPVREEITKIQRKVAKNSDVLIEGRDITSYVLPNADFKFYIDASPEVRAKRRINDIKNTDQNLDYNQVLDEIIERDRRDREREVCPLILVEGANYILTDNMTIDEEVNLMYDIVKGNIK